MKKGFTLVELLAVITIMGVILLISVPNITKSLKQTTSNQYAEFVSDIFLATESYITSRSDSLNLNNGNLTISVERLIKSGYFKSTTINPKTNEKVNINSYVIVSLNSDNTYKYTYVDENQPVCSKENQLEEGNSVYYCDPGDGETRRFYLIEKNSDETVLLLDKNIGESIDYDSALKYLEDNTKDWYDVEVNLPTGEQIALLLNYGSWNSNSDNMNLTNNMLNINTNCSSNLCTEKVNSKNVNYEVLGYWVDTTLSDNAWVVSNSQFKKISKTEKGYGIRPVITIKNRIELSE